MLTPSHEPRLTNALFACQQTLCERAITKDFVSGGMDAIVKRDWLRAERERLGWSPNDLAKRAQPIADEAGYQVKFNQQLIWNFEKNAKKLPGWFRYAVEALSKGDAVEPPDLEVANEDAIDDVVMVELLPTFVGAGGGGTGEGDPRSVAFSRSLVEGVLRMSPENLLAVEVEGDSMVPAFMPGDQLLIDRRKTTIAQPGAFCLWDGDGYVIKYLEKIHRSDPPSIRVISGNSLYTTEPRLVEEVEIMGRVVWFGRRV